MFGPKYIPSNFLQIVPPFSNGNCTFCQKNHFLVAKTVFAEKSAFWSDRPSFFAEKPTFSVESFGS